MFSNLLLDLDFQSVFRSLAPIETCLFNNWCLKNVLALHDPLADAVPVYIT